MAPEFHFIIDSLKEKYYDKVGVKGDSKNKDLSADGKPLTDTCIYAKTATNNGLKLTGI